MKRKAFVLLSGGLDSTTCLYKALEDFAPEGVKAYGIHRPEVESRPWVEAVSVNYNQRHGRELEAASFIANSLGIHHTILDVGSLLSGSTVMLSKESVGSVAVPDISYSEIKGVSPTYVPFRNGLLLAAITAHAQKYVNEQIAAYEEDLRIQYEAAGATEYVDNKEWEGTGVLAAKDLVGIYFGAHAEDAHNWAYPDCTPEFIGAMANAVHIGSYYSIRLHTPLEWLNKKEVVLLGSRLYVPFEQTWSCYKGEELQCGICPTCRSRREAFVAAGVPDLTKYQNP